MTTLLPMTGWSGAEKRFKYCLEEQSYASYLSQEALVVPGRVSSHQSWWGHIS